MSIRRSRSVDPKRSSATKPGTIAAPRQGQGCINLDRDYGQQYKVVHQSFLETGKQRAPGKEPRAHILLCKHGYIAPSGGRALVACTYKHGGIARKLKALPYATVIQSRQDGVQVLFDARHFDEVAEIMNPRKRRHLSEEQKRAAAERLRQYRARPGEKADQRASSTRHVRTIPNVRALPEETDDLDIHHAGEAALCQARQPTNRRKALSDNDLGRYATVC